MIGRLTIIAEQIQAGDYLLFGDEYYPRRERVRFCCRVEHGIEIQLESETKLMGLEERALVERDAVELPALVRRAA